MKPLTFEQRDAIFKAWEDSIDHEDGGYFAEWVHDNSGECSNCAHSTSPNWCDLNWDTTPLDNNCSSWMEQP